MQYKQSNLVLSRLNEGYVTASPCSKAYARGEYVVKIGHLKDEKPTQPVKSIIMNSSSKQRQINLSHASLKGIMPPKIKKC